MKFTIAIEPGSKKTAFGIVVPDLPCCFSAGDTVDEAFDNAREAIEAHLCVLAAAGKARPEPKPMTEWQANEEYKGWIWGIVEVPTEMVDALEMLRAIRAKQEQQDEKFAEITSLLSSVERPMHKAPS